ncbi:MAG: c-type cytochrome [Bryobacteraceae bacterium]|jgi:mono/diheme cytochrome c family protein
MTEARSGLIDAVPDEEYAMRIMALLCSMVLTLTAHVSAQKSESHETATGPERALVEGAKLYTTYCAYCHGKDGKGPGQLPLVRGINVPDLQLMASRNRGVFPLARVEKLLSGTSNSPIVHGGIEMPLWGPVLSHDDGNRSARELRVHALARYLESLQK